MEDSVNELALFAGAGGGILAGQMLGWRTVCAVEWEAYPASVLAARQNDGMLEPFPIWDDVRTFDGRRWRGRVDVVSGGFPCQDISAAGKGEGIDGERSGMWVEMARIIGEVRPSFVFVENSPMLTSRGLGRALGDLAALGFDAEWGVLGANAVGAWQRRERIWVIACCSARRRDNRWRAGQAEKWSSVLEPTGLVSPKLAGLVRDWADTSPRKKARVLGVAHGLAGELDGIAACGNGQVPQCAATAFIEGCRRLMA
jgi:DNA (cytosine-5)-methyltransferase 1